MSFSDIHTHILYGADDGAKDREYMYKMVDASYENGTRLICATPHFHPGYFGDNRDSVAHAFSYLTEYCAEKYPDMSVFLGNELFYTHDSISWMKNKLCLAMGNTRHVLVEFDIDASEDLITEGADRLLSIGYIPIIAHAERYRKLGYGRITALRENGVLLQMNAQSLKPRRFSFQFNNRVKTLLSENLIDFVSTDAHDLTKRPPNMRTAYDILAAKYGCNHADKLCRTNAERLLSSETTAEVIE